jgi:transcription initiation factor TFIIIB Brf1 subunit/transcription initiation factor TFIIB
MDFQLFPRPKKKSGHICKICSKTETANWRRDLQNGGYFCNACGVKIKKSQGDVKRPSGLLKQKKKEKKKSRHLLLPKSIHTSLEDTDQAYNDILNLFN